MKKTSLFVLLLAAGALQTVQAESKLKAVNTVNANGDVTQSKQSYYNADNQLAFSFTYNIYNGQASRNAYLYQFYDEQGRLVADSSDYNKTYYTYDNLDQLVKKVKWSNNHNPNYPDTPQDSTMYFYTGTVLDSIQEVSYGTKLYKMSYDEQGRMSRKEEWGINYYNNYQYGVVNRTEYSYDANGNLILEKVYNIGAENAETLNDQNRYYYNEQNQLVCDTLAGQWSTSAHAYTYNEEGLLATKSYSNYTSYNDQWSQGNTEQYLYADYSPEYALTHLSASADATVPTTVLFSFEGPARKQGFEGCQLMVDGVLRDDVYSLNAEGQLVATNQQRGLHTYRLLPVFNGQAANVTDELAYTLEFTLPTPTNLHFINKEFSGNESWGNWNVTVGWEAPEANGYELQGYKWTAAGNNGSCAADVLTATFYDYGWNGPVTTVSVQAVYNVGLSDAVTIEYVVADHADQITTHWHNDWATMTDANGNFCGKQHMLYLPKIDDYNIGEDLYATVTFDTKGKPLYRTDSRGMETKKWNSKTWGWEDYRIIEATRSDRGFEVKREEKVMTEDGWQVVSRQQTYYDNPDSPNTVSGRSLETLVDGVLVFRYFTRSDDGKTQEDTYTDTEGNIVGKTVRDIRGWDRSNTLRFHACTEYDYADGEFVPVSRVRYGWGDDWSLNSESYDTYANGEWTVVSATNYAFTASKEYSRTHTPEGELTNDIDDNDNPVIEWPVPVRTKGLSSYDIYIDDVKYASVDAETCRYEFGTLAMDPAAIGYHKVRVMALYDEAEGCLSSECEVEVINASGLVSLQGVGQQAAAVMIYDLTGRQIRTTDLTQLAGQMVIVRTKQANGEVTSRTVLLQ